MFSLIILLGLSYPKSLMVMMKPESSNKEQIQDRVVGCCFAGSPELDAATMSMMAHEHDLPSIALAHRLKRELRIIGSWLDQVDETARVLDIGCGAGTWVEVFARAFG